MIQYILIALFRQERVQSTQGLVANVAKSNVLSESLHAGAGGSQQPWRTCQLWGW